MKNTPYKMKSAPVNMRTPGSIAKMAGVSPVKDIGNLGKAIVAGVKGFAQGSRNTLTDGIKQGYSKAKKAYNKKESPTKMYGKKSPAKGTTPGHFSMPERIQA